MKKRNKVLLVCSIMLIILAGCNTEKSNQATENNEGKVPVVTTYSIIYDIVSNIGGDRVAIHSLAPVGSNPHEYDPLPQDVEKTTDAAAVFYNGLHLEAGNSWFDKLLTTAGKDGKDAPVFRVSEGVEAKYLTTKGSENETDPHAWLDIRNGIIYAENVKAALIKVDPEYAATYEQNAEAYVSKLAQLHEDAVKKFNEIPQDKRFLITSEGAFKYFSAAYGFEAGYIWEINSENQGSPDQISAVVDLIREKDIKVLFLETSIDKRSMEMVSNETKVPIGGKVFTDSIGKPGEDGDSYMKMMEWNINTILEQLQKHSEH
jgi:ABC-type Zn uptake system ZnuABC Zn-binding protein ZnuA